MKRGSEKTVSRKDAKALRFAESIEIFFFAWRALDGAQDRLGGTNAR
jgi:hypothetical protein